MLAALSASRELSQVPLLGGSISNLKKPMMATDYKAYCWGNENRHVDQNRIGVNTAFLQNARSLNREPDRRAKVFRAYPRRDSLAP